MTIQTSDTKRARTAIDADRGPTSFRLSPDAVRVIGRDTSHKSRKEHVLWQKRALLPADEAFAQAMANDGFSSVIKVRKDGPFLDVVEGRRRTVAARRANEILAERGKEPLQITVMVVKGSDLDMLGHIISENANRLDLPVLDLAEEANAYLNMGASEERAAASCGKTVAQLRQLLKLLDLDPKVQEAVNNGSLSASAAMNLADLCREDQVKALEDGAKLTVAEVKSRVRAQRDGQDEATKAPGRRLLNKLLAHENAEEVFGEQGIAAIKFVMGDLSPRQIKGLTDLIRQVSNKSE